MVFTERLPVYPVIRKNILVKLRGWNPRDVASQKFARNTSALRTGWNDWNLQVCIWIKTHRMIYDSCFSTNVIFQQKKMFVGVWPSSILIQKIIPPKKVKNSPMFCPSTLEHLPQIHGEDVETEHCPDTTRCNQHTAVISGISFYLAVDDWPPPNSQMEKCLWNFYPPFFVSETYRHKQGHEQLLFFLKPENVYA